MATPAMTDNSPAVGSISWAEFHIQYEGVEYTVPAGSTDQRWVWWRLIGGVGVVQTGPEVPQDLTDDDVVLFANKEGSAIRIQSATLIDGELIVDGTVAAKKVATDVMVANEVFSREAYLGTVAAEKIAAGDILAAVGILGSLAVGNITIAPAKGVPGEVGYDPGGIVIPQNTGGAIILPADGSPAKFVGTVVTKDLTVDGGMALNGLANYINGRFVLGSGTPDPSAPTDLGYTMFNKSLGKLNTTSYVGWSRGLAKTTSGHYATVVPLSPDSSRKELRIFDPVTKNITGTVHSDDAVLDMLGVTAIGNTIFVVGQRWNATASENQWRIHSYNTSGVLQNTVWLDNEAGNRLTTATYYGMAIAADPDGSNLWVARIQPNGKVAFYCYASNLNSGTPNDNWVTDNTDNNYLSGAFFVGTADFGGSGPASYRYVLGGRFGTSTQQAAYIDTGAKEAANTFGFNYVDGLIWDGAKFVTLDWDSSGPYLSTLSLNKTDITVYAQHDWTNTAGTKRSMPSSVTSRLIPKRSWPTLTVPAPPKTGSGADVASRVNLYLDTDAVTRLLTTVTTGLAATVVAAAFNGTGIAPKVTPATTDFVIADSTGAIESALGNISLKGDGSWKLGDLLGTGDGRLTFPISAVQTPTGTTYTGGQVTFVRQGNIVRAFGYVQRDTGFSTTSHPVPGISIPVGFRPAAGITGKAYVAYGSTSTYRPRFFTDGVMEIQQSAAISVFQTFDEMWVAA